MKHEVCHGCTTKELMKANQSKNQKLMSTRHFQVYVPQLLQSRILASKEVKMTETIQLQDDVQTGSPSTWNENPPDRVWCSSGRSNGGRCTKNNIMGTVRLEQLCLHCLHHFIREKSTAIRGRATSEEAIYFTPTPWHPPYAMRFPKSLTAERIFKTVLLRSFLWLQGNLSARISNIPLKMGRRVHGTI